MCATVSTVYYNLLFLVLHFYSLFILMSRVFFMFLLFLHVSFLVSKPMYCTILITLAYICCVCGFIHIITHYTLYTPTMKKYAIDDLPITIDFCYRSVPSILLKKCNSSSLKNEMLLLRELYIPDVTCYSDILLYE